MPKSVMITTFKYLLIAKNIAGQQEIFNFELYKKISGHD